MKVILLLVALVFAGSHELIKVRQLDETVYGNQQHLWVYQIDGCEYIGPGNFDSGTPWLTHKGNCQFCLVRADSIRVRQSTQTGSYSRYLDR